jgi:FKBP-type peptidyl-prolyl cis-trans isomerase 2
MIARVGDRVRVLYTRKQDAAGKDWFKSKTARALEFTVGGKHQLPGLSKCVAGMSQGEQKYVKLEPAEAFGAVQARLIREIPRNCFSTKTPLEVGMLLNARNKHSEGKRKVRIVELKPDTVVVDGNHPRAGRALDLAMYLISVDSSSETNVTKPQTDSGGES